MSAENWNATGPNNADTVSANASLAATVFARP